jgi:hypothetical protein
MKDNTTKKEKATHLHSEWDLNALGKEANEMHLQVKPV